MNEPERKEDAAGDDSARVQPSAPLETFDDAPKAYAFDGWGMVPLELDLA